MSSSKTEKKSMQHANAWEAHKKGGGRGGG